MGSDYHPSSPNRSYSFNGQNFPSVVMDQILCRPCFGSHGSDLSRVQWRCPAQKTILYGTQHFLQALKFVLLIWDSFGEFSTFGEVYSYHFQPTSPQSNSCCAPNPSLIYDHFFNYCMLIHIWRGTQQMGKGTWIK